jgi:hypothetical protein
VHLSFRVQVAHIYEEGYFDGASLRTVLARRGGFKSALSIPRNTKLFEYFEGVVSRLSTCMAFITGGWGV